MLARLLNMYPAEKHEHMGEGSGPIVTAHAQP
jgi:hypothetical protein